MDARQAYSLYKSSTPLVQAEVLKLIKKGEVEVSRKIFEGTKNESFKKWVKEFSVPVVEKTLRITKTLVEKAKEISPKAATLAQSVLDAQTALATELKAHGRVLNLASIRSENPQPRKKKETK